MVVSDGYNNVLLLTMQNRCLQKGLYMFLPSVKETHSILFMKHLKHVFDLALLYCSQT